MSEKTKEKRCSFCGKLLVDEKIPICLRCKLKGRNIGSKVAAGFGAVGTAFAGWAAIKNNTNNPPSYLIVDKNHQTENLGK